MSTLSFPNKACRSPKIREAVNRARVTLLQARGRSPPVDQCPCIEAFQFFRGRP